MGDETRVQTGNIRAGRDALVAAHDLTVSAHPSIEVNKVAAVTSPQSRLAGCRSFISVATEEAPIAMAVQRWIDELFPELVPSFVAAKELRLGDRWLEEVEGALSDIHLFFVVLSSESFKKHWLHFEAGTAWIRKRPIIVLTHSGLSPGQLPSPYSSFQSCQIDGKDQIQRLLNDIARHFDRGPMQRLNWIEFESEMTAAKARCHQHT